MPYSHHSHSGQFCLHAEGSLEECVIEAVRQGFELYGLSEHVPRYRVEDLYSEELSTPDPLQALTARFDAFLVEAHRLKHEYEGRIQLIVGLETEYITGADLDKLEDVLRVGRGVEYVVGSVHHVAGVPIDFDESTFWRAVEASHSAGGPAELDGNKSSAALDAPNGCQRPPLKPLLLAYFDAQYTLMQRVHPEIIAHFDLCRLYLPNLALDALPEVWARVQRNVRYAVSYGALFEVNAAAYRKGWDTAYPGREVLRLIMSEGGRLALSDDSHGPSRVGHNYLRAATYLKEEGVEDLWRLQAGLDQKNAAGRNVCAVKVPGDWSRHSFWGGTFQ